MFICTKPLILASASPRRQNLLKNLGISFTQHAADIQEIANPGENPAAFALRMAREKAKTLAANYTQAYILAADTIVTIDNTIIGKPKDKNHALQILQKLQGRTHQVITGVALICHQERCSEALTGTTEITFGRFPQSILKAYIETREPMDKAGAYGIQGKGAFLVKDIQGSCSNAIGLPVHDCVAMLIKNHVIIADAPK